MATQACSAAAGDSPKIRPHSGHEPAKITAADLCNLVLGPMNSRFIAAARQLFHIFC